MLDMQSTDELVIGVPEAATILDVSPATVARWARAGKLPYLRKLPGRTGAFLFARDQVVRRKAQEELLRKVG